MLKTVPASISITQTRTYANRPISLPYIKQWGGKTQPAPCLREKYMHASS